MKITGCSHAKGKNKEDKAKYMKNQRQRKKIARGMWLHNRLSLTVKRNTMLADKLINYQFVVNLIRTMLSFKTEQKV